MAAQGVTAYSLVQATVRALYSTMLAPETWHALVRTQDFDAVLNLLSKTAYGRYVQIKREDLTPRRTAFQVKRHLASVYDKIIRLTPEPGRQLVLWLWRLYEVDNLKAALRGIEAGASWDQVRFLLYPQSRHAVLTLSDFEKMVRSRDVGRAIELIRHTPYYDTAAHALERYRTERSLFPLEVALDLYYDRTLWQAVGQLRGLDQEQALRIVGSLLDKDNLLWTIRYRVYHHLSEQEIINYTLPLGYQVRDEDIRAIAAGADIASVVKRVYPDIGAVDIFEERNGAGLQALELALQRRIVRLCHAAFVGNPFHIGLPIAYLLLIEVETTDLTLLIEAKASQLPVEAFAPLLTIQPSGAELT